MNRDKRQRISWGLSVAFHLLLLFLAAASGLLSLAYADKGAEATFYEVSLEEPEGSSDEGGKAETASVPANVPRVSDVALSTAQQEQIAKEPLPPEPSAVEKKQEKKTEDAFKNNLLAENQGQGKGGSESGDSEKKGNGRESGAGKGEGTSLGEGAGEDGSIRDAQRRQPKSPPVLLSAKSPQYPRSLRNAGIEGRVKVRLSIGDGGQVEDVEIIESSGQPAMDSAAVEAAYGYRFRPAKNVLDEPVRAYVTRRITFTLQ